MTTPTTHTEHVQLAHDASTTSGAVDNNGLANALHYAWMMGRKRIKIKTVGFPIVDGVRCVEVEIEEKE